MVEVWRPSEDHERYLSDPAYLEHRFGVRPLAELFGDGGFSGVARLIAMPSFSGEAIHTFCYSAQDVHIETVRAAQSLWYSLNGGEWALPVTTTCTKRLTELPPPLNSWEALM